MIDNRKISICIPTWNRYDMPIKAIEQVIDDDRVSEIVIVDDCSTNGDTVRLQEHYKDHPKVRFFTNEKNLDCYKNKHQSVLRAIGDWCILFDSDNILTTAYLNALYQIPEWDIHTVYNPQFARPHFDFREYSGVLVTRNNAREYIYDKGVVKTPLETSLNAMNFFINRNEYLKIWDGSIDPVTSDSIYFSYCWLKAGNNILITPDLEYDHLVHQGHYMENYRRTGNFHNELLARFETIEQDI